MARPALSATRTAAVLDLFTAFPGRSLTMSDIMRATKINVASCHAVLNALMSCCYLVRPANQKSYLLGPALVAVGQAALKTHPLIVTAQAAAETLAQETGASVLLNTIVGDEIMALSSIPDRTGRSPGMKVGQRMPLIPPSGAHFLAWASDAAIEEWIQKAGPTDPDTIEGWRKALALVRARGFQVTLRVTPEPEFAALMAEMAAGSKPLEYRQRATGTTAFPSWSLIQPETIEPEDVYDVSLIAAPIFDRNGTAPLSLCLGGVHELITGAEIIQRSEHLLRTCLQVMREDRVA